MTYNLGMKKKVLFIICCGATALSFARKDEYDVISYSAPEGWKKETGENVISYTATKKNNWYKINIVKSTVSKGNIEKDFESERQTVLKNYNPTEEPIEGGLKNTGQWKVKAGRSKFVYDSSNANVLLLTATGYNRCASIVTVSNSDEFKDEIETFFLGVELVQEDPKGLPTDGLNTIASVQTENGEIQTIIGTWGKTSSINPSYYNSYKTSAAGYTSDQYTFSTNGTYQFISKTFGASLPKILLAKENGTYTIDGNTLTVNPQKSSIEAWTKMNGSDKWGKRLTTEKRPLEKITYQFSKYYFEGIQLWNLVLQSNKITRRDGPYSGNKTFENAWYYSPISANNIKIELPK